MYVVRFWMDPFTSNVMMTPIILSLTPAGIQSQCCDEYRIVVISVISEYVYVCSDCYPIFISCVSCVS